jgi:hypothetical protein
VLFSNPAIARFINQNFEPSWESVRPVPKVTIDFGNGTVVNRTLHGNVATYICNANQIVTDVLPGVYSPDAYLDQLKRICSRAAPQTKVHQQQIQQRVAPSSRLVRRTQSSNPASEQLFENLQVDTRLNEQRREQITAYLKAHFKSTPASMKFWLYREVLRADLNDPYLGLREILFADYPFVD